ncbi:unnamed protein product [Pieris macdunnoughi]|uniref:Uncharacterized protein n=1 Tax=Pieris macdunnoughi TaxID=345717 RepID=A0A821NVI3_9NEOP|nr:unnamed protein product [Pieris macdunnoughi]
MSSSSNLSRSSYSPSDPEAPQNNRNFDQSLSPESHSDSFEESIINAQNEMHQKRILALRKELDYLKATEWKFESDKGISQ